MSIKELHEKEKQLETLCKKYDLSVFESPRDNFIQIIESAEPTKEEKWWALEVYEQWLIGLFE